MKDLFLFEWRHIRNSGSFLGMLVIIPLLIGFSLHLGNERVNQQLETISQLREMEETFYYDKLNELKAIEAGEAEYNAWWQNPANPLVLAQFNQAGRHVFLEPKPLSALASGQLDIFPYYGKVTLTTADPLRDNALENPFMQVAGSFDFAFVLVWLIPLFVIVMGYNVISSERENGTYALLQSQPIAIKKILFYKLLFRFLVISGLIVISLILWALVYGINVFSISGLQLISIVLLYIAFWFCLCAIFNLYQTSSAVNAVGLAGLWVILLLVIPALISLIVSTVHPIPSRAIWITEQRAIQQDVQAQGEELFDLWLVDHPEEFLEGDTPQFYQSWVRRLVWAENIAEREQKAERIFEEPRIRQSEMASRLRFLSPPMALQTWLERKAGSDAERLRSLDQELKRFQSEWQVFFLPRFYRLDFFTPDEFDLIPRPS